MRKYLLASVVAILLGGCAETGAKLLAAGSGVVDAGISYGNEFIGIRQTLRDMYWTSVFTEAAKLLVDGKHAEYRELIQCEYPRLAILDAIAERDAKKIIEALNTISPCIRDSKPEPGSAPVIKAPAS